MSLLNDVPFKAVLCRGVISRVLPGSCLFVAHCTYQAKASRVLSVFNVPYHAPVRFC